MFKSKLRALNHVNSDDFEMKNNETSEQFKHLVAWIEDQKIRHYKIEQRHALRDFSSDKWKSAFEQYLSDIGCPFNSDKNELALDWLLNLAVKLEYEDNCDKYKNITSDNVKKAKLEPKVVQTNPLDNLDFSSEEFKEGMKELALMLKVPSHDDHLVTLKAISILVNNKLNPDIMAGKQCEQIESKSNRGSSKSAMEKIEKSPLGFDTHDKVLNHAAKVLRLLYIKDLRELQTLINEMIVSAQSVTANPKTDTALGKVGKK